MYARQLPLRPCSLAGVLTLLVILLPTDLWSQQDPYVARFVREGISSATWPDVRARGKGPRADGHREGLHGRRTRRGAASAGSRDQQVVLGGNAGDGRQWTAPTAQVGGDPCACSVLFQYTEDCSCSASSLVGWPGLGRFQFSPKGLRKTDRVADALILHDGRAECTSRLRRRRCWSVRARPAYTA